DSGVRTTLDIDADVLQAAKELAAARRTTAGRVLSELARRALAPEAERAGRQRHGVPVLPAQRDARPVTLEIVNRLRDETP
ncbi:MAG: CopG family transcriptional regulator, partial [Thermoanaerobaculia bacterium]